MREKGSALKAKWCNGSINDAIQAEIVDGVNYDDLRGGPSEGESPQAGKVATNLGARQLYRVCHGRARRAYPDGVHRLSLYSRYPHEPEPLVGRRATRL